MGKRGLAGRRGLGRNGVARRGPGTWGPAEKSNGEAGLGRREAGIAGAMAAISREHGQRASRARSREGFGSTQDFACGRAAEPALQ
jgi:hypothetical protein